jgi:endonuclease/exonuclease/phosphatase family metal-dependent hydrolase
LPTAVRRPLVAAALSIAVVLALAAPGAQAARNTDVTVMTRNLFLGGDLIPVAIAQPGAPFEQATGKLFNDVKATDPDARMKLVAGEIAKSKADLVGLQEVSTWSTGPKNDPARASNVVFDYLAVIRSELAKLGARYRVVTTQQEVDLEGPTDQGVDLRLVLRNAVLAKNGVRVSHARSRHFKSELSIPTAEVGTVTVARGWNQLDAVANGNRFHFVNTHLEAYSPGNRLQQAQELVKGPLRSRMPVILAGDLNSGPKLSKPEDRPPFKTISKAGFVSERTPKNNCCFNDDLKTGLWDHIVDWIMAKPRLSLVGSYVTGAERTASGVHPSDHGGVVSTLRFRR